MFGYKKNILKKGYVLIYTILIGIILLMIVTYCFTLEIKRKTNLKLLEKDIAVTQYGRETKEYLFSEMNNFVCSRVVTKDSAAVQQLFLKLKEETKIGNDDYYICYKTVSDKFMIYSISNMGRKKYDYYKYEFVNGKLNYIVTDS